MRESVLALVQLPPPAHGAAAVNREVISSRPLNEAFAIETIAIQFSTSWQDIGIFNALKVWAMFRNAGKAAATLWRRRPSLVYFAIPPHGGGFYANLPLVLLVRLFRAPLLYHLHGKGVAAAAARSRLYAHLFAWAMKGAHVILLSERLYADAAAFVPRERAFFLPNALTNAPPTSDHSARDGRHILFLSNLIESKGPLIVLDALVHLKARGVSFRASFAGAPLLAISVERLQAAIRARGLEEVVRYHGAVAGEEKERLLAAAAVLVLPTFNDAFPLVVLEAMAAGLATVATPEGAIPDMLRDGENGILVPYHDPEKLADALQRLLEDSSLCQRMGQRGQEIVGADYRPDIFHRRMRGIWAEVISISRQRDLK